MAQSSEEALYFDDVDWLVHQKLYISANQHRPNERFFLVIERSIERLNSHTI